MFIGKVVCDAQLESCALLLNPKHDTGQLMFLSLNSLAYYVKKSMKLMLQRRQVFYRCSMFFYADHLEEENFDA